MLSIKSELDIIIHINLVNNLICIFLQSSREDNYLIILGHQFDEMHTPRPHQEEAVLSIFNIVY